MGSSGSGNFGNYREQYKRECPKEIVINVEDFEQSSYYAKYSNPPAISSKVYIGTQLVNKRLVLIDKATQLEIGNVPISYNYIFNSCILEGINYEGKVMHVGTVPYFEIVVELNVK